MPMMTAKGFGLPYDKLLLSIGAALHFNNPEDPQSVEMIKNISELGLSAAVTKFTGITAEEPVLSEILAAYDKVEKVVE
jgi:mannitol-1-phosphate 5-dehydrogenase